MEIDPSEPPSWSSIVRKEKRFSLDLQFNFIDNNSSNNISPPQINTLIDESISISSKRLRLVEDKDKDKQPVLISQGSCTSTSSNNSRSGSPSSSATEDQEDLSINRPNLPIAEEEGMRRKQNFFYREIEEEEPQDLSINNRRHLSIHREDEEEDIIEVTEEFEGVQDLSIHSKKPKKNGPTIVSIDVVEEDEEEDDEGGLVIVEEDVKVSLDLVAAAAAGGGEGQRSGSRAPPRENPPGTLFRRSISFPTTTKLTKDNNQETEVKRRGRRRKEDTEPGKLFICFLCTFTSPRESVLNNHMTRMHTVKGNRGNVRCTVCAYSCPSVEELRSHQELVHGGDHPEVNPFVTKVAFHACTHCTKKFRSQTQLEAHLRLIAQKQLWKDLKARRIT